jgi:branched-chain amino acid transport system permease protein
MSEERSRMPGGPGAEVQPPTPARRGRAALLFRAGLPHGGLARPAAVTILAAASIGGPLVLAGSAQTYKITEVFVAVLFAVAVSFVMGLSGTPAFGNQLFYGAGAYLVAELGSRYHVSDVLIYLLAALAAGAVLGGVVSQLLRWTSGLAFGMVSIAIGQLVYLYVYQSSAFGGSNGISAIPIGTVFGWSLGNPSTYMVFTWIVLVIVIAVVSALARSRWGLIVRAARDSATRAHAVGIPVFRYKAAAFVIGAALSSAAGALYAESVGTVDPSLLYWTAGAVPILAGLLGGIRTVRGAILGALILQVIILWVSDFTTAWIVLEGAVTLGIYLLWPEGILGEGKGSGLGTAVRLWKRLRAPQPPSAAGSPPAPVPQQAAAASSAQRGDPGGRPPRAAQPGDAPW